MRPIDGNLACLALLAACGGSPAPARPASPVPASPERPSSAATTATSTTAPEAGAGTGRAEAPAAPASPVELPFTFTRVDATPVTSLAAGKPPKVVALSRGEARVFAGTSVTLLPAPETSAADLSVDVYFGRDDQPRLMGTRRAAGGSDAPYYRRYKGGRFQPEPGELGPLAAPSGALYGVLGHADPEVVCRPGLFCLVKRVTGWGRVSAHAEPVRVLLAGGTAWAFHPARVERLERDAWVALTPERAWDRPIGTFVDPSGAPWLIEAGRDAVTRLVAGRWETLPMGLEGPRAIWGTSATDVWVAGVGGAVHFDGTSFRDAPGVSGPLAFIAYSPPSLWLAGEAGVFRGEPTPRK